MKFEIKHIKDKDSVLRVKLSSEQVIEFSLPYNELELLEMVIRDLKNKLDNGEI